jgi:ATP-dependent RNA helicase DeaD
LQESFSALGVSAPVCRALERRGINAPFAVQNLVLPDALGGLDVLVASPTGSGKTLAFGIPLVERIAPTGGRPAGLVLVPTRELAMQVSEAIHKYAKGIGLGVVPLYGGASMEQQIRALQRGAAIVVATPGRALDHIRRSTIKLDALMVLVLDEADEMLDMGFAEDIEAIITATPAARQTALFSATMPSRIASIAQRHLTNPARITVARENPAAGKVPRVRQVAYVVARNQKSAALGRVLEYEAPKSAIVFCRTRLEVDSLTETLDAYGYRVQALHGGMMQRQRDRVLQQFRESKIDLLVATDVAARGLDIEHLSHVINYDVPSAAEAYVHRIGRTGRIGREGVAITLAEPREHRMLKAIEHLTKQRFAIEKLPTVADLRTRRLEMTRSALQETLVAGDRLERFRVVIESLSEEFDLVDIALAAVKLAHEASGGELDEQEIPDQSEVINRKPQRSEPERRNGRRDQRSDGDTIRLFFGVGRRSGVRPQDLVGAIANESRLSGRDIGAIEISDRYSLVEVPASAADEVIDALRQSTIKGKRATVRRATRRREGVTPRSAPGGESVDFQPHAERVADLDGTADGLLILRADVERVELEVVRDRHTG